MSFSLHPQCFIVLLLIATTKREGIANSSTRHESVVESYVVGKERDLLNEKYSIFFMITSSFLIVVPSL